MGFFFFFFQAEDGIRDVAVTGVQTCALPISPPSGCGRNCGCRERVRAPRSSAARRLRRADERAHELAVDLGRDGIGVDALVGEELARVFRAVDARRLDTDRLETGRGELVAILPLLEGAGH